jgi:hypothetical protein
MESRMEQNEEQDGELNYGTERGSIMDQNRIEQYGGAVWSSMEEQYGAVWSSMEQQNGA